MDLRTMCEEGDVLDAVAEWKRIFAEIRFVNLRKVLRVIPECPSGARGGAEHMDSARKGN